ncbi:carbohydrate ABC transporter permease [Nocardioides bruguierae]|uniref:Sugar ABC transporter permease n=1 Tax=Nocardioides bruguierae TaxID=2945102 RepID=A0A9X2D9X9_9ACTN|nr:sugar ABC transporter permease [Nocardioides bruguierae]MCL8027140.1 sugar ABC transporter permease [Nocardioides bruguierae]MCM0622002.1 sugar ABC transporter permease [Nocardioides bruguierae]
MTTSDKLIQMVIAVALFFGVMAVILLLTQRLRSRNGERVQAAAFVLPALLLILVGLLYPAVRTLIRSFYGAGPFEAPFVGLDNYTRLFTDPTQLQVLRNTLFWVILTPLLSTGIGLVYAILVDRSRFEKAAKALLFLPMAISMVGASIIWKFVYAYRSAEGLSSAQAAGGVDQIGLANQLLTMIGLDPYNFILDQPWNTFFLIVILVWIQAGFAMTILSASIKAIPDDIVEAARLDGVGGWKMFRHITIPSIRPSLIVVLTTITIATLKVFDIVQTATGGNFGTSVMAYEFYTQNFVSGNQGLATAIAVVIFVLVVPIVIYNVRSMRKLEAR